MNYLVAPVFLSGNNIGDSDIPSNIFPVDIAYPFASNTKIKNQNIIFTDGFKFTTNPFLSALKDSSITKNIAYYLTNLNTWDHFIYDGYNLNVNSQSNDTKILFDRLDNTGFFYAYFRDVFGPNPFSCLYIDDELNIGISENNKTLIKVVKVNNKVAIYFYQTDFINKKTIQYILGIDTSRYIHEVKLLPVQSDLLSYITLFNLTLYQDTVKISYDSPVLKNTTTGQLQYLQQDRINTSPYITKYIGINNNKLVTNHVFRSLNRNASSVFKYKNELNLFRTIVFALVNPGYTSLTLGIPDSKQNTWVGYYNEIYDKKYNKTVKPNPAFTVSRVPINYLLTAPFKENEQIKNRLNTNIVPLKTVYTPENETIKTKTVFIEGTPVVNAENNLQPIQRTYTKIFSSNNSTENYNNVHLGFDSSTREFKFKADEITYFHYPPQADLLKIQDSNLIESGALPGATPFLSDKIFMKNAAYGTKSVWGHLLPPPGCLNGQFLCSWLSGSDASSLPGLENSVWMDRWYDSAQVTEVSALQSSSTSLQSNLKSETIVDRPSELILNPGGWYYYHHIGNKGVSKFLDSFNIGNTGMRLQIKGTSLEFIDDSPYKHVINLVNRKQDTLIRSNPDNNLQDNYVLNLDNSNYATIQYADSLDISKDLTFSTWVQSDNWTSNPGNFIIDNGFRGGWSLQLVSGPFNPVVAISEENYGHGINFSTELRPYVDNVLLSGGNIAADNIVITQDLLTFIFDKKTKTLCKFDYDGDLIDLIDVSSYTSDISNSKLALGPNEILYLHFNDILIKTKTSFASNITSSSFNYSNFVIDLSGNAIGGNFLDAAIDNNNNLWFISACPVSFFTEYSQPFLDSSFFKNSVNSDFIGRSLSAALLENNDLNFIFYCKKEDIVVNYNTNNAIPISVADLTNNYITFSTFFPNNAENGVLSKFFQPTRLAFDENNYLYITNNTQELMKLIIDNTNLLAGFIFRKPLINTEFTSGVSLSGVNSYIQTNIIDKANDANRDELQFKYLEIKTTNKKWKDIKNNYKTEKIKDICLSKEYNYSTNSMVIYLYYINNDKGILSKFDTEGNYIKSVFLTDAFDPNEKPKINYNETNYNTITNTYDEYRKYILPSLKSRNPVIELRISTLKNNTITETILSTKNAEIINKEWHHVAFTYEHSTGKIALYFDGNQVDFATVSSESEIYYRYKNNIGIGVPVLKFNTLRDDIKTDTYLFQGKIDDIRLYDHVLTKGNIGRLILNKYKIHDIVWNLPVGTKNYIEEIIQFFKHKPPGSKSSLFNLYLTDSGITDRKLQVEIENIIKEAMPRVAPSYTRINKIIWT